MRKVFFGVVFFLSMVASADAISKLYQEFLDRDLLKLGTEQGAAVNFLKLVKYPVENIQELEVVDASGSFVIRDNNDIVCLGNPSTLMLRCKNKIGLTTITYQGDAD